MPTVEELADQLSALERRVLLVLRDRPVLSPEEVQKRGGFQQLVEVMNAASWLKSKGLATVRERVVRFYSLAKRQWATKALPERRALKALRKAHGRLPMAELGTHAKLEEGEVPIAIGWLKRKGWAVVEKEGATAILRVTEKGDAAATEKGRDELLLEQLAAGELSEDAVDKQAVEWLVGRQEIVKVREAVQRTVELTDLGKQVAATDIEVRPEVAQLTPDLLQSGEWEKVTLRRYDVHAYAPAAHGGKLHPVTRTIERVRRLFVSMGFTEIEGDFIQPAFWVFDALFQPQDHPARDMLDTFYVDKPERLPLPPDDVVRRVADAHETGGNTGSLGWRYKWNRAEAEKAVLRPHTTPLTLRYLAEHPDEPAKAFVIGRTFRRDAMDATHLPEFTQVEGVVMEPGANLRMLIGVLTEFYRRMGFEKVRFRPGYFPYTEPSMEPEVYFNGQWMELGGSGIFRPEVTQPLGIKHPVLAWGLGLERIIMAREGLQDIRQLYLSDVDWLRRAKAH